MSIFPLPAAASPPKTEAVKKVALLYAALLTIMAVAQLFTFEEFLQLIPSFHLPLPGSLPYAIAPFLVASEVFALPFLLRMALSPAFRWFSLGLSWVVVIGWLGISLWLVLTRQPVETVGFLGTVGSFTPGWWAILMSVALLILALWTTWGLWPRSAQAHKTKK